MVSVRSVLVGLAFAFSAYLAARGLAALTEPLQAPLVMIAALGLYLLTTWLCLLVDPPRSTRVHHSATHVRGPAVLPAWAAGLAFLNALIVPSALAGALLVLVADCVCRVLPLVTELRLGIALSLVGAPFFLWLLLRLRREAWL